MFYILVLSNKYLNMRMWDIDNDKQMKNFMKKRNSENITSILRKIIKIIVNINEKFIKQKNFQDISMIFLKRSTIIIFN